MSSAVGLASCGLAQRTKSIFGGRLRLEVEVAKDLNQNSPVAVEVVVAYRKKLLDEIMELPAGQWFEEREQFERDHAGGYDSWFWEWVPGQDVVPIELDFKAGAEGAVVFADYLSPGDHRLRIEPRGAQRLVLGADDFTVEPREGGG